MINHHFLKTNQQNRDFYIIECLLKHFSYLELSNLKFLLKRINFNQI